MENPGKGRYSVIGGQDQEKPGQVESAANDDADQNVATSSIFQSLCNLLCDIEGTALLTLPYAIQRGGMAAIAGLVVVPFICWYTGKILVECLYDKDINGKKIRVRRNYKDMADAWWPRYGGVLASSVQVLEVMLLCSLYIVLCGSLLNGLLPNAPVSTRVWMLIAAFACLPTIFIKHFAQVSWFSLLSIIALTAAVLIVLGYGLSTTFQGDINKIPLWDAEGTPLALTIIVFGYNAHPSFPSIESDMKNPKQFNLILVISFLSGFLVKTVFSLVGFLVFYPHVNEVITNSIPVEALRIVVNTLLVLNVFCSLPFAVKATIHIIEDSVDCETLFSKLQSKSWFVFVRLLVFVVVLVPAVSIPHFPLLMSFASSIVSVFTVFALPCLFHLTLQSESLQWYHKAIDYLIIAFGLIFGLIGLAVSSIGIAKSFM